jgi:hypothetical protein
MTIPPTIGSFCCHTSDGHGAEDECPYDRGGIFIAKGTEKVVVCPIILQNNYPFIRCLDKNGHWSLQYRSLSDHKKRSTSTITIHLYAKRGDVAPSIKITVPFIAAPISLASVLRLLGVPPNLEGMMQSILGESYHGNESYRRIVRLLRVALQDPSISMPMEMLVAKLGRASTKRTSAEQRSRTVLNNFTNEFLPNMGLPGKAIGTHWRRDHLPVAQSVAPSHENCAEHGAQSFGEWKTAMFAGCGETGDSGIRPVVCIVDGQLGNRKSGKRAHWSIATTLNIELRGRFVSHGSSGNSRSSGGKGSEAEVIAQYAVGSLLSRGIT